MMANVVDEIERHRRKREAWDKSQRKEEKGIRRIWKGGRSVFGEEDNFGGGKEETCRG
jgi:hypothetical protein